MINNKISSYAKKSRIVILLYEDLKIIKDFFISLIFYVMRVFPVNENKVVIDSYGGKGYGDNGKYIAEKILEMNSFIDVVWLCDNLNERMPEGIRTVKFFGIKSIYEQSTAKFWIDNRRKPGYVRKRISQIYINTWHAGIALKRIEKDAQNTLTNYYIRCAKHDSSMVDYFLSDSEWTTNLYKDAFWYTGDIWKIGLPRQDVLVHSPPEQKQHLKNKLGIKRDVNIVLYAPTFRNGSDEYQLQCYNIDWNKTLEAFRIRFGGEWIGAIRLHPNISRLSKKMAISENIIDVTNYPDMQELSVISDCIISDYSSSIIDCCPTGKLGFIFAVDISEYQRDRNFYFDLRELPFPIAESNEELVHNIIEFDTSKYKNAIEYFYYKKCGLYPIGQASETVAKFICENAANC